MIECREPGRFDHRDTLRVASGDPPPGYPVPGTVAHSDRLNKVELQVLCDREGFSVLNLIVIGLRARDSLRNRIRWSSRNQDHAKH